MRDAIGVDDDSAKVTKPAGDGRLAAPDRPGDPDPNRSTVA
jgi:hypothetical protein